MNVELIRRCKAKKIKQTLTISCALCEAVFNTNIKTKKYCSRNCSLKAYRVGDHYPPCKCGAKKDYRAETCKKCFTEKQRDGLENKTLKEFYEMPSIKNKHPSWRSSHVRVMNRAWNANLIKLPCQVCGYSTHINLCHIKDIADFDTTATLGEINHPNNILVLCPNHHWEFDNDIIKLADIPKRDGS